MAAALASAADREEIAFLDVETSAPPARVLLEFGAIVICSRSLVDVSSYATLVRPTDPDAAVPVPTARCNGITRDTVADAPPFRDVADKVYDVLHGRVWAGHNIERFDSMIIRDAFAEIGRTPPQHKGMIDTLPLLTRWFGPRAGDMKMASLANYFGLGKQRHRSLDDVKMNIDVFKNCATVLFLEASLREVLTVQNLLEGAAIRSQGTDDPATNRDLSRELVGPHGKEMVLDSTMQMDSANSGGFSEFIELEDVSTECIKISVMLLHPFGPRTIVQHKGAQLQLSCPGLQVRWLSTNKFLDNAGRPKLSIVVDIPENLSKVLEFCDDLAQSSSPEACSNSEWKPLIKRYGNANRPTVRLNISTVDSGDNAIYATRIYQKEPNGVIPKLVSRVDAEELEYMLQRNRVDALFSLEIYDYQQNAGIRLVAKRLDVHFKGNQV